MTVSFIVIAYNEERALPDLLADITAQTYPKDKMEIVLVDSASTDNTKALMQAFAKAQTEYIRVQVLDNPKKKLPCGWNVALDNLSCEIVLRVDAHARIPQDFVEKNVKTIEGGEDVCGGIRPCRIENNTAWGRVLLQTENSLFGSSINSSRRSEKKSYVKTIFHAAYKKEVFDRVGKYNENLFRTEDNEMHYRMRKAGYQFCYDPDICSYQYARSSLKRMVKQKYGNGHWIGLTMGVCPKCFSLYHFIPLCFVLGILATTVLAFFGVWQLAALMWGAYALFAVANTVLSQIADGFNGFAFLMPLLFLILHISYGVGTLWGLIKMPFWLRKIKRKSK